MLGRPILYRQVGYRFYRPAAFAVAAVFSDIPFNASNIVRASPPLPRTSSLEVPVLDHLVLYGWLV